MLRISKTLVGGLAAWAAIAPMAAHAGATPVVVTNSPSSPIPSVITNTSGNPVQAKIVSSSTTPVYTKSGDNPGLSPAQFEVSWFSGTTSGFSETASFTVPAGKHFVIEGISVNAYAPASTGVALTVTVTAGGTRLTHYLTGFQIGPTADFWLRGLTPAPLYADAGSMVTLDVVRQKPPGASMGYYSDVIITGHYVDVPLS